VLLLAAGAALALNGIFPWEIVDGALAEPPAHTASAIATFLAAALGLMAVSRRMAADDDWRGLAPYTRWSGVAVFVLFLVLGLFAIEDGAVLHDWAGLIQRVLVAVWFAWTIVVAVRIARAPARSAISPPPWGGGSRGS
jgi:hypothetical protein